MTDCESEPLLPDQSGFGAQRAPAITLQGGSRRDTPEWHHRRPMSL